MTAIPSWTTGAYAKGSKRYRSPARWFHWLTALLIFAIVPLGWIFAEFKTEPDGKFHAYFPGTPAGYASVHKTLGLLVLALVAARLIYRFVNKPPALPSGVSMFEAGTAHATHWLLYGLLLVMPISGYIMSSGGNRPISILGMFDFPKLPGITKAVAKDAAIIHLTVQFAVYALVILHVAAVCWHLFVRRDDLLGRMLPRQANVD